MLVRTVRKGETKIRVDTVDDLWYLKKVISVGDKVVAETERKYRTVYGKEERKRVKVELSAESVEFHKYANVLRIRGKILCGAPEEYVKIGAYHTIDVAPRSSFILKKELSPYDIKILNEAERATRRPIIQIVVLDDRRANFAVLRGYGLEWGCEIVSGTSKADPAYEEKMKKYYSEIVKALTKTKEKIVIAGPGFAPENFLKYLMEKDRTTARRTVVGHTSTAERSGIYEVIKSGFVAKIIKEEKLSLEFQKIEAFLAELRKNGLAVYGKQVIELARSGALKELYVLDELVRRDPDILNIAKGTKCDVTIFTSEDEPWRKLKVFGGLAGLLRYKLK